MHRQNDTERFLSDLKRWTPTFRYQLLDRMNSDCKYFLGAGARQNKYLWAGDPQLQIVYMKALWDSFPEGQKPEWLSYAQICRLEQRMKAEEAQDKEEQL